MEKYEVVRDLGSGSFAVTRLMRNSVTNELFAVKFLERGPKINETVAREILNHRSLRHPNIIRFIETLLTPTHLAVKMEYAAGGNLLQRIQENGTFSEDEATYFFQQLISGISFCHAMRICHRDLKLENILLDGSPAPRLKICDFGFSKSAVLHNSETVGTPTYIAPEVLSRREYDGRLADVWSCGVTLYVMLVGAYPFEDQADPKNFRKTINRIMAVQYQIPDYVHISQDCKHLLSRIFVANPSQRITIKEIKNHPWFMKNLSMELTERAQAIYYRKENPTFPLQSVEEIMKIMEKARLPPPVSQSIGGFGWAGEEEDDEKEEEEDDEYEKRENSAMEEYEVVRDLGSGSFAVTRLMRNPVTNELFAVKFLERGPKINENVKREIINHRELRHPNIIRFIEAGLTQTHLAVKMEYATGGNLLQRIQENGRFSEDEARYFFQQLISGISYCHAMQISHGDLKLENILLDGSPAQRLKICNFSFSSSDILNGRPRATVGTPTYVALEVYTRREDDGKLEDVWSCGVILYAMLVGAYPFEGNHEPENFTKMISRITKANSEIPDHVQISENCRDLLSRILVTNPLRRINIREIKLHPWFLKNLPMELTEAAQEKYYKREEHVPNNIILSLAKPKRGSIEQIMKILRKASIVPSE